MSTEKAYKLTLKGWFIARAMITTTLEGCEEFWDDLADMVKFEAMQNGYPDGIPALIFSHRGDGATVIPKLVVETDED